MAPPAMPQPMAQSPQQEPAAEVIRRFRIQNAPYSAHQQTMDGMASPFRLLPTVEMSGPQEEPQIEGVPPLFPRSLGRNEI